MKTYFFLSLVEDEFRLVELQTTLHHLKCGLNWAAENGNAAHRLWPSGAWIQKGSTGQ
jgi:hypothetical protein